MKEVLGQIVPAGKTCEDLGVCFCNAEAVVSIGKAFESGQLPTTKILTLVKKDGTSKIIKTPIVITSYSIHYTKLYEMI